MRFAFDTETSGLVDYKRAPDDPAQPRLVQLGAVLVDQEWREIQSFRLIIRPAGWVISEEAIAVHGITNDMANRYGVDVKIALSALLAFTKVCRWAIAHNWKFDSEIIKRERALLEAEHPGLERPRLRQVCTMITGAAAMPDGKYPSLAMLYEVLTDQEYLEAHDGLSDARAALTCCRKLLERKLIEP